jgi:hypothetical protein
MTTFIGMAVVDLQRWDRNKRKQLPENQPTGSRGVHSNPLDNNMIV